MCNSKKTLPPLSYSIRDLWAGRVSEAVKRRMSGARKAIGENVSKPRPTNGQESNESQKDGELETRG